MDGVTIAIRRVGLNWQQSSAREYCTNTDTQCTISYSMYKLVVDSNTERIVA